MKAWVLYDARIGLELPQSDTLPFYFDNEEDAKETQYDEHQEIKEVHILTDEELKEERLKAFEVGKSACICLTCGEKDFISGKPFEAYEKSLEGGGR